MRCTFLVDPQTKRFIGTICGPKKLPTCSFCGMPSGLLCDFPAARKKTCDKPICKSCAIKVAANVDFCPDHPLPASQMAMEFAL